ncbi:hypothetical protein [Paenibacillus sp. sgz500958]|uniref:hypothetical protein n=1 Tax=Paenibacillus sp. sgz500958 TaxID=3242475 RepID=UPI0036D275C0
MNEDRRPDWYALLKSPVPGGGFSPDQISETLEKADPNELTGNDIESDYARPMVPQAGWTLFTLTPEAERQQRLFKRRLYNGLAVATVFILLWVGLAQTPWAGQRLGSLGMSRPIAPAVPTASPSAAPTNNPALAPAAIIPGQTYEVHDVFTVKPQPESYTSDYVFRTKPGQVYTVSKLQDIYALIAQGDKQGWLPAWYLTPEVMKIKAVTPYPMLVPRPNTPIYLFPGSTASDPLPLDDWRVVQVVGEYNNGEWLRIEFKMFEAGVMGDRWMKASDLRAYDPKLAKEGRLKAEALIYDESGSPTGDRSSNLVMVTEPTTISGKGDFYFFYAPGGLYGLVKQEDFIPNPFSEDDEESLSSIIVPKSITGTSEITLPLPANWSAIPQTLPPRSDAGASLRYRIERNGLEVGYWAVENTEPPIIQSLRADRWIEDGWPDTANECQGGFINYSSLGNSGYFARVQFNQTREEAWKELSNTSFFASTPVAGQEGLWYNLHLFIPYSTAKEETNSFVQAGLQMMGMINK